MNDAQPEEGVDEEEQEGPAVMEIAVEIGIVVVMEIVVVMGIAVVMEIGVMMETVVVEIGIAVEKGIAKVSVKRSAEVLVKRSAEALVTGNVEGSVSEGANSKEASRAVNASLMWPMRRNFLLWPKSRPSAPDCISDSLKLHHSFNSFQLCMHFSGVGRCYSDTHIGGTPKWRDSVVMDVKRLRQRVVELEEQLSSSLQHQGKEVYTLQPCVVALCV